MARTRPKSFYQSLTPRIKEEVVDYLPPTEPANFQENLAAYNTFLERAKKGEKKIKSIFTIACSVSNTRTTNTWTNRNPGGPRLFLTLAQNQEEEEHEETPEEEGQRTSQDELTMTI
jgi:hypothetical protein